MAVETKLPIATSLNIVLDNINSNLILMFGWKIKLGSLLYVIIIIMIIVTSCDLII